MKRFYTAMSATLLGLVACAAFLEHGHPVPRGALTDWFCQLLPPYFFFPATLALTAWGLSQRRALGPRVLLAVGALALLLFALGPSLVGGLFMLSGFRPGGG